MNILEEANALVHGDRFHAYGHPNQDFQRIAELWMPILGFPVTKEQVGLCMIALKLARETFRHKRDNLTDICGYAENLQRIAESGT